MVGGGVGTNLSPFDNSWVCVLESGDAFRFTTRLFSVMFCSRLRNSFFVGAFLFFFFLLFCVVILCLSSRVSGVCLCVYVVVPGLCWVAVCIVSEFCVLCCM